jgi:hypothetical protein
MRRSRKGLDPDVIVARSGRGEAFFVKDVFPRARFVAYAEYCYGTEGGDSRFDPEFSLRSARRNSSATGTPRGPDGGYEHRLPGPGIGHRAGTRGDRATRQTIVER